MDRLRPNRQENITITGNTTLNQLSNGLHNITVYAKDTFGNAGASKTICFRVTEPFPITLTAAAVASVTLVCVGLLIYFKKRHHQPKMNAGLNPLQKPIAALSVLTVCYQKRLTQKKMAN